MKKGETEINNDNDNNTKIEIEHNIGNLKRQEISQELGMLDWQWTGILKANPATKNVEVCP